MSRVARDEFVGRVSELDRIRSLGRLRRNGFLLGAPRVGKSELLRQAYDWLFSGRLSEIPILIEVNRELLEPERFANEFLSQLLIQVVAYRSPALRPDLLDAPLAEVWRAAPPEDHSWVRALIERHQSSRTSGDPNLIVRGAFSALNIVGRQTGKKVLVLIDDAHLLASETSAAVRSELERATVRGAASSAPSYLLGGLRRPLLKMISANETLFERVEMIDLSPLGESAVETLIMAAGANLNLEISNSTAELMIQQLNRDLFYIRAILTAASSRGQSLRTFIDFERIYSEEVVSGRIANYFEAVLRSAAATPVFERAALEALAQLLEPDTVLAREVVVDRIGRITSEPDDLLNRLHDLELLNLTMGFVEPANDPVLADFVLAKHRREIAGKGPTRAGSRLVRDKLKQSYRLMMSRYFRGVESQLVELLSRFDFQSVPSSVFDCRSFENHYRGVGRTTAIRLLDNDEKRVRLPQIVVVDEISLSPLSTDETRLFSATGFEGGIYSTANEVLWQIALVNGREPLEVEDIERIEALLGSATPSEPFNDRAVSVRRIRWYISKEGFSAPALDRLAELGAHSSSFFQLDLLYDYLAGIGVPPQAGSDATEFELTIPIESESELIAARTAEQVARTAGFDQQAINQIKTALVEACLNAAEHSECPDRRIHHKFAVTPEGLSITISSKGTPFAALDGVPAGPGSRERGRGLQIIRALMDEVRFERTDDGARLVIVKYLKQPEAQQ